MASIESMTVGQIREILVNKYGYSPEQAEAIKGKANLGLELARNKYNVNQQESEETVEVENATEFFEGLEREAPSADTPMEQLEANNIYVPTIGSAEWEDYVKAHLLPNEYFEKNDKVYPKTAGLSRVAKVLLGDVVFSGPIREYPPLDANGPGRATVVYQIVFNWMGDPNDRRTFLEAADAWVGNTPAAFAVHPIATASTRAEGRCYKKALQLNLYTAEEMVNEKDDAESVETLSDGAFKDDAPITGAQISNITRLCERHSIDLLKFLAKQYPNFVANKSSPFEGLLSADGSNLCATLNKYQSKGKDHIDIPEEIKVTSDDKQEE